jgi:uncharacterized protein (UPF0335 family)
MAINIVEYIQYHITQIEGQIARRKKTRDQRYEEESILDTYLHALGMDE